MFWQSVRESFRVFLYWETYVTGLEYFAIVWIPFIVLAVAFQKDRPGVKIASASFFLFGMPILQVIATAIYILTLWPIILGISDDASWSLPWRFAVIAPRRFAWLIVVLAIAMVIASIIPLLGRLRTFPVLAAGVITLTFVVASVKASNPDLEHLDVLFLPSLWFIIGILFVGGAATFLGIILSGVMLLPMASVSESFSTLFMMALGGVFGFIPVFIYGAWLGAQVQPYL